VFVVDCSLVISFTCNICGTQTSIERIDWETPNCSGCGSNVRKRAIVYLLTRELFGESFILSEVPRIPAIKGIGLSDDVCYAVPLAGKFDYTNTFYDREPYLDITEPDPKLYGTYDFILSSDVFEHVPGPVERAFEQCYKLLKPGGVLCITVPSSLDENTVEHYPDLHEYAIVPLGEEQVLVNRKKDGTLEVHDRLVFHGGHGATLEMRVFSRKQLTEKLRNAGFSEVAFQDDPVETFGIVLQNWSRPLVARKEPFAPSRDVFRQLLQEYQSQATVLSEVLRQKAEMSTRLSGLQSEKNLLETKLRAAAQSKWVRLGNRLGRGPRLS
jgi:SAM-dependent methyltransferase